VLERLFIEYYKSTSQYKILGKKNKKIHIIINPIFCKYQHLFLACKSGDCNLAVSKAFTKAFQPVAARESGVKSITKPGATDSIPIFKIRIWPEEQSSTLVII
jgi:hypothetical protein